MTSSRRAFLSTPSARRATSFGWYSVVTHQFLSTPSARRATAHQMSKHFKVRISIHALREEGDAGRGKFHPAFQISIHALREEGDNPAKRGLDNKNYFYPRPPRGGRHSFASKCSLTFPFLSTPSARRATFRRLVQLTAAIISIHALREEGDALCHVVPNAVVDFYPRPPRGGRLGTP